MPAKREDEEQAEAEHGFDVVKGLRTVGVGLSRLLRYSFPGFLLIALATVINPEATGKIVKAVPWQIAGLSLVVIGAGIYATHRSVVIPLHHLLLCLLFWLWEHSRGIEHAKSLSPTRWLASLTVPRYRRIWTYTMLRRGEFFNDEERESLNISHAENGLVVLLSEGFAAAALYAYLYPKDSQIGCLPLAALACVFWAAAFPAGFELHSIECMKFRARKSKVEKYIRDYGVLE